VTAALFTGRNWFHFRHEQPWLGTAPSFGAFSTHTTDRTRDFCWNLSTEEQVGARSQFTNLGDS
jgi:hypothetical protein